MSGFNFGSSAGSGLFGGPSNGATTGGFSFGGTNPTTTASGFSFDSSKSAPKAGFNMGGLSSGTPNQTATSASSIVNPASSVPTTNFSFGGGATSAPSTTNPASSNAFSFNTGFGKTDAPAPATNTFSFSSSNQPQKPSTDPVPTSASVGTFGGTTNDVNNTQTQSLFGFGASNPAPPPTSSISTAAFSFSENKPATTAAAPSKFSFGDKPSTASVQSSGSLFGAKTDPTPQVSSTDSSAAAAIVKPSFPSSTPAASSAPNKFSLGAPSTTAPAGLFSEKTTTTNVTATKAAAKVDSITWQDLEGKINKWNTDIEQQVSVFIKQATQVNAWSSLLLSNGEKISDLCSQLENVKIEQDDLDQELDRVNAQQVELEAILVPLEEAVSKHRSASQHHVDNERERTYNLAGSVDAQIKLVAQDLREVIDRINSQQGNGGNNQVEAITSILSAHTDALQWVEEQSSTLQRRLDQVNKAVDTRAAMDQRNF